MKKLALLSSSIGYFLSAAASFAQAPPAESIKLERPSIGGQEVGYDNISDFITKSMQLIFIIGVIAVLVMIVWGGVQWILSGGEKEAVGEARKRIINALIGLAILAVAFAIAQVAGTFLGINIFSTFAIPSPS